MGHVRDQAIHVRSLIKEKRIYYAQMILKTKKRRLRSTRYVPPVLVVDRGVSQTQKGGQKALCATLVGKHGHEYRMCPDQVCSECHAKGHDGVDCRLARCNSYQDKRKWSSSQTAEKRLPQQRSSDTWSQKGRPNTRREWDAERIHWTPNSMAPAQYSTQE